MHQHLRSLVPVMNDNGGQMIFGDLGGLKLPDIYLTGEEKPQKDLTQEACPNRDRCAYCRLSHNGGRHLEEYSKTINPS